jgi:putative ABC transport system substrate-binding protein
MRRRHFIALIGSLGFAPSSAAAQTPRIYRVGILSPAVPSADNSGPGSAFLKGMAERGYRSSKTSQLRGAARKVVTANYPALRRNSSPRRST